MLTSHIICNFPCCKNTGVPQLGEPLANSMFRFIKQIFSGHQFVPGSGLEARDMLVNKTDKNPCLPGVDILVLLDIIHKDL